MPRLILASIALLFIPTLALSQEEKVERKAIGSWELVCRIHSTGQSCGIVQQQATTSNDARQRLLALELLPVPGGALQGSVILPFGLELARGVKITLGGEPGAAVPFKTCVPAGCVVSLNFSSASVQALAGASEPLLMTVVSAEDGQERQFKVDLNGFSEAVREVREKSGSPAVAQ